MLNTYACPHPINRLRQSPLRPDVLSCQDCLGAFSLEQVCGHDLHGAAGQATNGKTWRLVKAMNDKSTDATPLKDFLPEGRTVDAARLSNGRPAELEPETKDASWRPPGRA